MSKLICPYCGYEFDDMVAKMYENKDRMLGLPEELMCPKCHKMFKPELIHDDENISISKDAILLVE